MQELRDTTNKYRIVEDFFGRKFEIPELWEYPKFSDVVYVNPKTKMNSLTAPYIPMEAVNTQDGSVKYFEERKVSENPSLPKFQDKDTLFARITPCTENGKMCFVDNFKDQGIASSELTVLRPSNKVSPKYLFYFVRSHRVREFAVSQMLGTTGRQRVPDSVFKEHLYFELPPIQEQQKITSILSKVDELIQKTDQIIEQTQRFKKGLMQSILTKGIGHTRFKQTSIGEIPEEWKISRLETLCKVERGKFTHRPRNDPVFYDGKYPFIQTGDVEKSDVYIESFSQTLNEKGLSVSKIFPSDIIAITIAGTIGSIGITTFPVCFPDSIVGITANKIDLLFLYYYLETIKEKLQRFATVSAQPNINLETLRPLEIPLPSTYEQLKIASILSNTSTHLRKQFDYKIKLEQLKKGLMQNLLTGKIRVKV